MIVIGYHNENARDLDVVFHEGKYYCLYSFKDALWIKCAENLSALKDAQGEIVFTPDKNSQYSKNIWAPELHFINDEWHIYFTMGDEKTLIQHMYVLRNHSKNPLNHYEMASYIDNGDDQWAIDATIIHYNKELYYVYSSFGAYDGEVYQALYIAKMKDPYSIEYPRHLLSRSTYDWEKHGSDGAKRPYVNEGPFAIYHNGKIHIVYSASGCWTNDYCLGLLTFKGGDILDEKNWEKHPEPILSKKDGYAGPGHASFIQNDSSGIERCFFHAFENDCSEGQLKVYGRSAIVTWNGDIPQIKEE